jgi:hypothetical protein
MEGARLVEEDQLSRDAAISEAIADDQLLAGSDPVKPPTLASAELTDSDLHDIESSSPPARPVLQRFSARGRRGEQREYW